MVLLSRLKSKSNPPITTPRVPDDTVVYAIGDIHGELHLLEQLLEKIEADSRDRDASQKFVVFMGDVIDRGGYSKEIITLLSQTPFCLPGFEPICLLGNHEQVMLDFFDHPENSKAWFRFGAVETLASYGIRVGSRTDESIRLIKLRDETLDIIPQKHLAFLRSLKTRFTIGDYFFSHAGIRPGISLDRQSAEDLLWIREPFLSSSLFHEKVIVHGHTVHATPQDLPNRIGIDTGAYATGVLTALVLTKEQRSFLQAIHT
jgi:serine/threonine protein phosphatase 1